MGRLQRLEDGKPEGEGVAEAILTARNFAGRIGFCEGS